MIGSVEKSGGEKYVTEKKVPIRRTTDLRANYVYEPWPTDKLTQEMRQEKAPAQVQTASGVAAQSKAAGQ